jgi:hypothetical protein
MCWHARRVITTQRSFSMKRSCRFFLALVLTCPFPVLAQQGDAAAATSAAPAEAKQFDFLLGHWDLEVHPKVSGLAAMIHGTPRLVGTWKAWRTADGLGIEDEMSIVDASGNPISLSRAQRAYASKEGLWKISGHDVTRGRSSESTGKWQAGEMRVDGRFTDADGVTLTRTRYYGITAESFHMQQDRSSDNGQSWEEGSLTIDAKRTAATATATP